jgi:acetyltransferase-like isoleucine patch superfamily enzyme
MILIGENVTIEQNLHLTCANRIVIGNNTAIAANVTITDIEHPYTDVNIPIERHDLVVKEVVIGEDSKIYNNAVILPGVHIGKHCVIGANSVVARDIPDFSVAVGAPSRVVKQYDRVLETWVVLGGNTSERSLHTE